MSLIKKVLPLVAVGALALGITACPSPTSPEKPEEPITPPTTEVNDYAPVITSTPDSSVNEGENYNYQLVATDADGNPLTYSKTKGPAGASISATGLVSYPTSLIDADVVEALGIKVSDGKNEVTQEWNVRIKDLETRAAITGAADRLIALQDNNGLPSVGGNPSGAVDGSWDWDVTNKTTPSTGVYLNIAGVTADGLLAAYDATKETKYLDAAKKAGNFIMNEISALPVQRHFNAFNMIFLNDLAQASGDTKYSEFVKTKMNDLFTKVTYFGAGAANINPDGQPGLTAEELVAAEEVIRETNVNGIKPWDLYHFVELAKESGNNNYALQVANGIKAYLDDSRFDSTDNDYLLGLAGGIIALKNAGLNYSSYLEKLVAEQNSDGHFETPDSDFNTSKIAATAYALMALKEVGHPRAAQAVKYLADSIGYGSGIQGWLEGTGTKEAEISEPDGEAGKALGRFIK